MSSTLMPKCSRPQWALASAAPIFSAVLAPDMFTTTPFDASHRMNLSPQIRVESLTILKPKALTYQPTTAPGSSTLI